MNIYLVGGAVRDKLLGQVPKDLDYVVTNSTKDEMISLGFLQVGIQFPIFIHPKTKDEYALPRGKTLEEDLFHRDITINSMAMDSEGQIIDPYGGAQDLENKIIRHVSDAFKDDPFRVYRVMRFKARFPNFNIAPETIDLMKEIINTPSFKSISPDRIIKELRVVLSLPKPSLFFEGLKDLKALYCFFPELEKLINVPQSLKYHPEGDAWTHTMLVLDQAASLTDNILVRYSCLVHDLGKGITIAEAMEVPGKPVLGVQFHPEKSMPKVKHKIFGWLLKEACIAKRGEQ